MRKLLLTLGILSSFLLHSQTQFSPCVYGNQLKVVVLGSSTAAGTGPSHTDSTWVNRYRKYLQSINVNNDVVNLALGGTSTYQIMPDNFVPPSGRPNTDPSRNISEALRQGADAIIINMPSNDAALGYSTAEQLNNFRILDSISWANNIPIWICTTQPRNFSTAMRQVQVEVRDSILSIYGNYAVDFWSGMADTSNGINPIYDSGDGVHLNDAAHRILYQRVVAENIPVFAVDTLTNPDVFVFDFTRTGGDCGATNDVLRVKVSNYGQAIFYDLPYQWLVTSNGNSQTINDTLRGGLSTCADTSISVVVNTEFAGYYAVSLYLSTQNDSDLSNDTMYMDFTTSGLPGLTVQDDSVCKGNNAVLVASGGDTIRWFDKNGTIIEFGDTLFLDSVTSNQQFFAEAIKGPFHYNDEVFTTSNTSINFGGIMFAIAALDTLTIDSFSLKIEQAGAKEVTAYYLNGNYKGDETNAAAWTLWGADTAYTNNNEDYADLSFGSQTVNKGDTFSVYMAMQSGYNLQYLWSTTEQVYQDSNLSLISGTGVGGYFTSIYYPRIFSGSVYYHYGFNPDGICSNIKQADVYTLGTSLFIGNDTIIGKSKSFTISVPSTYSNVQWSTGDTSFQITINGSDYAIGSINTIYVNAIDGFGCFSSDTLVFEIKDDVSLNELQQNLIKVYPNPSSGGFYVDNASNSSIELEIINGLGQSVKLLQIKPKIKKQQIELTKGVYLLFDRTNLVLITQQVIR